MTVRVGVIGVGVIGQDHVRRISQVLTGGAVVAVTDVDAARAGQVAAGLPGAVVHATAQDLIGDDGVDAVLVASWGPAHEEQVLAAIGAGIPLMVDMNCPLDGAEAIVFAQACRAAAPKFLEEPVWPPEDFVTLAEVRKNGGLDIAAGENACTVHQFRQMMTAGAVSYAQPSVTKVGGITEYLKVAALADERGVKLAPHSPYFGPGFLATLQLMSLRDDGTFVEVFYMKRAACLWGGRVDTDTSGTVAVPEGPGLGYEPDREIIERYRVA